MTDKNSKFILYTRKIVNNPLLCRKQVAVELIHPESGSISKVLIKDKLSSMFKSKPECMSIYGLHTKYGGGRSTGFALIYDSAEVRAKYDMKMLLLRDKILNKDGKTKRGALKEIKRKTKRARGKEKTKAMSSKKK